MQCSSCQKYGTKKTIRAVDVNQTHDLRHTRRALYPLNYKNSWRVRLFTRFNLHSGRISNAFHHLSYHLFSLESPTCSLTVTQGHVGGVSSLTCQGDGVPLPKVTDWEKNSKPLPVDSNLHIKPGKSSHQEQLDINNFGMADLGVYECFVSNKLGSSSCAVNISGKIDHSLCGMYYDRNKTKLEPK